MDFVRYAERAARLVNAPLEGDDGLHELLADRDWLQPKLAERDARVLRRFQRELRPVFEAASDDKEEVVVERLNALLAKHPVTPYIAGHDSQSWHLHVSDRASSVADLLVAEALMGLAVVVCDFGATRPGRVPGVGLRRRLRRHLPQPVAPLLLRTLLVARQRRRVPRPPQGRAAELAGSETA